MAQANTQQRPPHGSVELVRRVLAGGSPEGATFEACRAVVRSEPGSEAAFHAMAMLLEGALADPRLDIDSTRIVVWLLKELARGRLRVEELV